MQTVTYSTSHTGSADSFNSNLAIDSTFLVISLIVSISLLVIAHAIMAQGVSNDVKRLGRMGRQVRYFGSTGWAFVVLFLGIVGLGAHWVMHHSTFRDASEDRSVSEP
jgi:hypothetical protein